MTPSPAPPARSLRRRRWQEVELAALDFETTGLDLRRDAVISFGVIPLSGGRIDLSRSLYQEVSPPVPLGHASIAVHHLRPVDLADAPPLRDVADRLHSGLEGRFLVTWYAEIEASFLARLFGGSVRRWLARSIDVRRLALLADRLEGTQAAEGMYSLAETVARAGLPVEEAHDALNDALMTAELFLVAAARLARHGYGEVRGLIRESRRDGRRSRTPRSAV